MRLSAARRGLRATVNSRHTGTAEMTRMHANVTLSTPSGFLKSSTDTEAVGAELARTR
jgi:hypothetical protein